MNPKNTSNYDDDDFDTNILDLSNTNQDTLKNITDNDSTNNYSPNEINDNSENNQEASIEVDDDFRMMLLGELNKSKNQPSKNNNLDVEFSFSEHTINPNEDPMATVQFGCIDHMDDVFANKVVQ